MGLAKSSAFFLFLLLGLVREMGAVKKDCLLGGEISWELEFDVYRTTCPAAEEIIFAGVERAVAGDPRMAASLLRLHFHDCFVNGCDASVLLDDSPSLTGEKSAGPNANSLRGFDVIDEIKSRLESVCPQTVSCADLLAVSARDAVFLSGGPTWDVELGRMDSLTASKAAANRDIPAPTSGVKTLVGQFKKLGLSPRDMVALSGGHTIGNAKCTSFNSRFRGLSAGTVSSANELGFLVSLQQLCGSGNSTASAQLDLVTPASFDNQYYVNLLNGVGLLASDQALVNGGDDEIFEIVKSYAENPMVFFQDFKAAMVKMGRLKGQGGSGGEIRSNCRIVN